MDCVYKNEHRKPVCNPWHICFTKAKDRVGSNTRYTDFTPLKPFVAIRNDAPVRIKIRGPDTSVPFSQICKQLAATSHQPPCLLCLAFQVRFPTGKSNPTNGLLFVARSQSAGTDAHNLFDKLTQSCSNPDKHYLESFSLFTSILKSGAASSIRIRKQSLIPVPMRTARRTSGTIMCCTSPV